MYKYLKVLVLRLFWEFVRCYGQNEHIRIKNQKECKRNYESLKDREEVAEKYGQY